MTYQVIGAAAKDENFQARCRGSVIALGAAILAAGTDSNAIQNAALQDLTTTACKNLALNYCKGTNLFTDQALAMLMLLNNDVAANPVPNEADPGFEDAEYAMQWQTKEIWLRLVDIG